MRGQTQVACVRLQSLRLAVTRAEDREIRMRIVSSDLPHECCIAFRRMIDRWIPSDLKRASHSGSSFPCGSPQVQSSSESRCGGRGRCADSSTSGGGGQMAGDCASTWSRRMKINIHDIDELLLDRAMIGNRLIERAGAARGRSHERPQVGVTSRFVRQTTIWRT